MRSMSKAFTREDDEDGATELPDRIISSAPNLVTPEGLAAIDTEIDRRSREHADAAAADDMDGIARAARELRYWSARRQSARLVEKRRDSARVGFGSTVTIERDDGKRMVWRIVGEDEADPARGLISHVAPVARALMDREVGDTVETGPHEAEIVGISV
jgi:transcription elongation GreA/GreB family factor